MMNLLNDIFIIKKIELKNYTYKDIKIYTKMTDIKHDFEYYSLKLSICIIDIYHKNLRAHHSLHRQTYSNTHHCLWNEVLGIVETYAKKSQREIKQVYVVFNKNTNLKTKNKKMLYDNRFIIIENNYLNQMTELEKMMYFIIGDCDLDDFEPPTHLLLELPIYIDKYLQNYLIIETTDNKYIIARYGSVDGCDPQFYGYDEQTEFCDLDALPIEFKKPIEELKQKIKMIDDASTIGKVQKDDYIPDPQEGSKETWEYMNTPEYKRQEQYLQSDEYNIVQNDKIVTDIREPTNVFKQIDIKNPDITITTTKNNVVKTKNTNSKINSKKALN